MEVNVRLAEGVEVTLQMEAGGHSEISPHNYTAFVQKTKCKGHPCTGTEVR